MTSDAIPNAPGFSYAIVELLVAETLALGRGDERHDAQLLREKAAKRAAAELVKATDNFIDDEMQPDLIRADCELLEAWWYGHIMNRRMREQVLKWVLNRRGVVEWPSWAADWVDGGGE